jgi:hypothetical protein
MYINNCIMQVRSSGHAEFRMYQTQTVIVGNINAVAATRCPARWILVYQNKLIQENTCRYCTI